MRILWLKAGGLAPLDTGGKIRSYHILSELARKHEVTLYTFYREHPNDAHPGLEGLFAQVVCRPLKIPAARDFLDCASYVRRFFSRYPHTMSRYYRPEFSAEVRDLVRSGKPNVIVCDFLVAARVIPWDAPIPKILFAHNVEALIYRREAEAARNPIAKFCAWKEIRATEWAERKYVRLADHVVAVSEKDRSYFGGVTDPSKITAIPTGVDLEYFRPDDVPPQPATLVFTGSLDWQPNEDAVHLFVQRILPRIRGKIPEASVLIVGRRPSPKIMAHGASDPRIRVTGTVGDVRPYLRQGSVCIVPLRAGSGTRLKIFEAMAMGKAVVSTSIGAEGLPVEHGKNILIADTVENFAESVADLLRDPERCLALGQAARQLVERGHSWAEVANRFEEVLLRLTKDMAARKAAPLKEQVGGDFHSRTELATTSGISRNCSIVMPRHSRRL